MRFHKGSQALKVVNSREDGVLDHELTQRTNSAVGMCIGAYRLAHLCVLHCDDADRHFGADFVRMSKGTNLPSRRSMQREKTSQILFTGIRNCLMTFSEQEKPRHLTFLLVR